MVGQPYQTDVAPAHVISGNAAVLSCVIPSFVADLVRVQAWTDSAGATYFPSERYGNQQTLR